MNFKLPLTTAAANWLVKNNRDYASLASWDVVADGWPTPYVGDPIYVAVLPPWLGVLPVDTKAQAEMLQRKLDPEENFEWVFVPSVTGDEVWLVHVKRIPTALN